MHFCERWSQKYARDTRNIALVSVWMANGISEILKFWKIIANFKCTHMTAVNCSAMHSFTAHCASHTQHYYEFIYFDFCFLAEVINDGWMLNVRASVCHSTSSKGHINASILFTRLHQFNCSLRKCEPLAATLCCYIPNSETNWVSRNSVYRCERYCAIHTNDVLIRWN